MRANDIGRQIRRELRDLVGYEIQVTCDGTSTVVHTVNLYLSTFHGPDSMKVSYKESFSVTMTEKEVSDQIAALRRQILKDWEESRGADNVERHTDDIEGSDNSERRAISGSATS